MPNPPLFLLKKKKSLLPRTQNLPNSACSSTWFHEHSPNYAAALTKPHNQHIPFPAVGPPTTFNWRINNIHILLLLSSQRHSIKFTQHRHWTLINRRRDYWEPIKMLWEIQWELSFEVISNYVLVVLKTKNMYVMPTAEPYKVGDRSLILPTHTPEVNRFINNLNIFKVNTNVYRYK